MDAEKAVLENQVMKETLKELYHAVNDLRENLTPRHGYAIWDEDGNSLGNWEREKLKEMMRRISKALSLAKDLI